MRFLIFIATVVIFATSAQAQDNLSGRFLFRVVEQSEVYADTLSALIKGRGDIPNWVRNMVSRGGYVAMGSSRETVGGKPMERFMACQAGHCPDSQLHVLFSADGKHAVMRVVDKDKGEVFLGDPSDAEKAALIAPDD